MNRDSDLAITAAKSVVTSISQGNAVLVQLTGNSTPNGTVDFQSSLDGVTWTNTPYRAIRSVTAAKSVAQLSSITTLTEYLIFPPLTQFRIEILALTSGNIDVVWREIKYPFDPTSASGGGLDLADNEKIRLGNAQDAEIYYDGTNLIIDPDKVGSGYVSVLGDLRVENGSGIVIGHTAPITGNTVAEFQILGTGSGDQSLIVGQWSADVVGPSLEFVKSRNTTIGSNTILDDNDVVGSIVWMPDDGADFATLAAQFRAEVDDGTPEAGFVGMAFVWRQMPGGNGNAIAETMRLSAGGALGISLAPVAGTRLTLPQENDAVTPTLAFGDGDSGFYESSDDVIGISILGNRVAFIQSNAILMENSTGPGMLDGAASATNVTIFPSRSDVNTGLGTAALDQLSLIAGAFEILRLTESTTTDDEIFALFAGPTVTVTSDATSSGHLISLAAQTFNFNGGVNITTPIDGLAMRILAPVIASDSAVVITQVSSLYVAAPDVSDAEVTATANLAAELDGAVLITGALELDSDLNHDGSNVGFYGVAPVARSPSWTITNDATDRAFDANANDVLELADVVATLITDLAATGIIGASA